MSKKELIITLEPPGMYSITLFTVSLFRLSISIFSVDNSIKFIRGYIACLGTCVEYAANNALAQVAQEYAANQLKR